MGSGAHTTAKHNVDYLHGEFTHILIKWVINSGLINIFNLKITHYNNGSEDETVFALIKAIQTE